MSTFWQKLNKPIIGLAPMDGVTDFPMREIQAEIGKPDVMYTEFISIEGFLRKPDKFLPKLKFSQKQKPIIAQLFGSNPDSFVKVIPEIVKLGFDGIDINMGCPSKNILEQGGGGALIGNYPLVKNIINSALKSLKIQKSPLVHHSPPGADEGGIPLSIKTRIADTEKETKKWLEFLSSFSISAICVHARPLKQLHSGPVAFDQLEKFSRIFKSKKIIFLGNGGIKNREEGLKISKKYHLDGVLIGQSAIGNPWVFSQSCHPEHFDCHSDPEFIEGEESLLSLSFRRSPDHVEGRKPESISIKKQTPYICHSDPELVEGEGSQFPRHPEPSCHPDPELVEGEGSQFPCHSGLDPESIKIIYIQKILFSTLLHHADLAWDFYGPKGFPAVRKHFSAYCKNFPGAKDLRQQLLQTSDPDSVNIILQKFHKLVTR